MPVFLPRRVLDEAVEVAATNEDTKYSLGSVLNHVLLHQTVIGLEAQKQMEMTGEEPDVVIGCVGGGSNYAGLAYPFMGDRLEGKKQTRFLAAEPAADLTGASAESRSEPADRDAASAAMAALEHLPGNQREALILTKVHGRSHAEAAMIAGTTPGAIKLRAHRAYVTLRQRVAGPATVATRKAR